MAYLSSSGVSFGELQQVPFGASRDSASNLSVKKINDTFRRCCLMHLRTIYVPALPLEQVSFRTVLMRIASIFAPSREARCCISKYLRTWVRRLHRPI